MYLVSQLMCVHSTLGKDQLLKLFKIAFGPHLSLIPCFQCNRAGDRHRFVGVPRHVTGIKDFDFWKRLLEDLLECSSRDTIDTIVKSKGY
jgi:hypothetical protein